MSNHLEAIRAEAHPLDGSADQYEPLMSMIGNASIVLLGEASHGTHEFYSARADITRRLILEKGFNAVAVEADWPDAYRVNRWVRGSGRDADVDSALAGFQRFPTWMWRNRVVVGFVEWLKEHNASLSQNRRVGFYGLDLYSLFGSIDAVLSYLEKIDPEAAGRARHRYACFEHFGEDTQAYGYAASSGRGESCEEAVVRQLLDLQRKAHEYSNQDGFLARDEFFFAEQNARLVKNAEEYYRAMFRGRATSWNLRDTHMTETLDALVAHLRQENPPAKVVVWEHNSHLGDARATEMASEGELNVGQLVRERYGKESMLVGFSTNTGTVTAATDWGGIAERKKVRPGLEGSYEALLHDVNIPAFLLPLRDSASLRVSVPQPLLQRAIGVIYRPRTERISHYFEARLLEQFDALIHIDVTNALEPLETTPRWESEEPPETYPFGL